MLNLSIVILAALPLLAKADTDGTGGGGSVYGERIGVGVAVAVLAAVAIFSASFWIRRRRAREFRQAFPFDPAAPAGAVHGAPGGLSAMENGQAAAFAWEQGVAAGASPDMQAAGQKPPAYIPYRSDEPGTEQIPGRTYNLSGPAPALPFSPATVPADATSTTPLGRDPRNPHYALPAEPERAASFSSRAAQVRFARGMMLPAGNGGGSGRHF